MYFALIGKTPDLSLAELEVLHPVIKERLGAFIIFEASEKVVGALANLAGIIKRGKVVSESELWPILTGAPLIWVNTNGDGVHYKKTYGVKRFKVVSPEKSDKEVIEGWIELLDLGENKIGVVQGRQDIERFELLDFEKPVRGMQIGMMPAKLTQMLVNIGVAQTGKNPGDEITVYDPFVGFGTTVWIANSLGYHTIWSDINITPSKQNQKRWVTTKHAQADKRITLFKHDVNDALEQPFLKHADVIVTEGRLGPVVNGQVARDTAKVKDNISQIIALYEAFLNNTNAKLPNVPIVITIPVYLFLDRSTIEESITNIATDLGYEVHVVGEVYSRKKQLVGRRIVVLK